MSRYCNPAAASPHVGFEPRLQDAAPSTDGSNAQGVSFAKSSRLSVRMLWRGLRHFAGSSYKDLFDLQGKLRMNFVQNSEFELELMDWLIAMITNSPGNATATFEALLKLELWKGAGSKFRAMNKPAFNVSLEFQSHWFANGHKIRDQINSDFETAELLKHMMPSYNEGDKVLYRGESKYNWDNGPIGFCWTDDLEVAEMFAGGMHNGEHGAVIIEGRFPASAIIAGPEPKQTNKIRDREREFTIDPFCDVLVEAIRCHGPYDETGNFRPDWPLPSPKKRRCQSEPTPHDALTPGPINWYPSQ